MKRPIHTEIEFITRKAAELFGVTVEDIFGRERPVGFVAARFAAIWAAKEKTKWSDKTLARYFMRERSTVCWALKSAADWRDTDSTFREKTTVLMLATLYGNEPHLV